jgi:hypothetical protein
MSALDRRYADLSIVWRVESPRQRARRFRREEPRATRDIAWLEGGEREAAHRGGSPGAQYESFGAPLSGRYFDETDEHLYSVTLVLIAAESGEAGLRRAVELAFMDERESQFEPSEHPGTGVLRLLEGWELLLAEQTP